MHLQKGNQSMIREKFKPTQTYFYNGRSFPMGKQENWIKCLEPGTIEGAESQILDILESGKKKKNMGN